MNGVDATKESIRGDGGRQLAKELPGIFKSIELHQLRLIQFQNT